MTIKRKLIEQIRVTGLMTESDKAFEFCNKNGFTVKAGGPLPQKGKWKRELRRFGFFAEREVVKV